MMLYLIFFFFFQAEDGIRDADVTGVQTCALPISLQLAQRSFSLQTRAAEGTVHPDRILLARVHAARGDAGELGYELAQLDHDALSDDDRRVVAVLELAAGDASAAAWQGALDGCRSLPAAQRLELFHLA